MDAEDEPPNHYNKVTETQTSQYTDKPLHSLIFGPRVLKHFNQPKQRTDIKAVTYNGRMQRLILLDSRGCSSWSLARNANSLRREFIFPKFQFNILIKILFCKEFNVYFGIGKDRSLRVYNRNFEETQRACTDDSCPVSHLLFNPELNEVITGGDCVRFWSYKRVETNRLNFLAMFNYRLVLRHEFHLDEGRWCTHMELDVPQQRLYFFSHLSIVCCDMAGTVLTRLKTPHSGRVLASVFSPCARMLLTAHIEIKGWSEAGHLLHVFQGHSRPITSLILHPTTPAVFISASLDCSIRLWCLNSLTQIISIPCLERVLGLGLTEENLMFSWSLRSVQLYHLNHFLDFWGYLRYPALSFKLCKAPGKTNRLLALGDGNSLHIFSCSTGKKLCLMPPHPFLSPLKELPGFAYDRQNGLIALLLSSWDVWMYTARTDPACRVAELDVREFQKQSRAGRSRQCLDEAVPLPRTDAAVERCTSLGFLNSVIYYETVEGPVCASATSFLLCGMADGQVLFMDIAIRNLVYYQLKVHKDPVVWLCHDLEQNCLMTMCEEVGRRLFLTWSLPQLEALHQICVPSSITAFTWMGELFFVGFHTGAVRLASSADSGDGKGDHRRWDQLPGSHTTDDEMTFNPYLRQDHNGAVLSVDSSSSLQLFLSCGCDTLIKLWDRQRTLLAEVQLDSSLSCACFLNPSGDLLVGFRLHLYKLSQRHLFSSSSDLIQSSASQASLTDSFIYERPELAFDGKHGDPVNMESYIEPYKGFDFSVPPREEAPCEAREEDEESDWEVPHAPSLTYQSLESCVSVCSAASSQTFFPTPGQSLTNIHKLLELKASSVQKLPFRLPQTDGPSTCQSGGLDLWDMATVPDVCSPDTTESSDVILDAILDASPSFRLQNLTQQTPLGTASSTSQTNTSVAQDMNYPPEEQRLPISRFANIHISISNMKTQAKPSIKTCQMAVPDPCPLAHPPCSPPSPVPPLPHLLPPPKATELKKQVTDVQTRQPGPTSIVPSARKQVSNNRKQSISKPTPLTTKRMRKASDMKAVATKSPARGPKSTQEPQRPGTGPINRVAKQNKILKDRADEKMRKEAALFQTEKKVVVSTQPSVSELLALHESHPSGGVWSIGDLHQGEERVQEEQTGAAEAATPLMVKKKPSRHSRMTLTSTDGLPKQPNEDQGADGAETEDAEDHMEQIERRTLASSGGFMDLNNAEPMVREPSPGEHTEESEERDRRISQVGWKRSTEERLHKWEEEEDHVCEQEESFQEKASSSRSSSSVMRGGGEEDDVRDWSEEAVKKQKEEEEQKEFSLVRPVSMTDVSRTHHPSSVRKEVLAKIISKISMSENQKDEQASQSSTKFGSWVSLRTDIRGFHRDVSADVISQKEASREPLPLDSDLEDQRRGCRRKRLSEDAENWINQELLRQLCLRRLRRERQQQVQEKRADLEQNRLQRLVRQPYHAFCGNLKTDPDGPSWFGFSSQQEVCSVCQQHCDRGREQGRPASARAGLNQRTSTQGLHTDQPYRLQMPIVSQNCVDSTWQKQNSKSKNRVLPRRPHSSASIPSKGHFVLTHCHVPVSSPPSQLEERLLKDRFPKYYKELSAKGIIPSPLHTIP